jgi:hypothetical protein
MRTPRAPVSKQVIWAAAKEVLARVAREVAKGASSSEGDMARRRVNATALLMERGWAQKQEIDGRGKREPVVHRLDVDIDLVRLRAALESAGDTQDARTCAKQVKAMLKQAKEVSPGVARHRVEYCHSELGRDLLEAGHVVGSRLYARGADPFKWAKVFRHAAMHGAWEADDTACFPTARQAMTGGSGGVASHFLAHRAEILAQYGTVMFGSQLSAKERRARLKQITTAYDMGASLDFWKRDNPEAEIGTLKGCQVFVGGRLFSLEAYRDELCASAKGMAEKAEGMMAFICQPDVRSKGKRGKRRRARARPELTLKSYVLQEAEAVSREAKMREAEARGARVVSLQHDGIAILNVQDGAEGDMARGLGEVASQAVGYSTSVVLERVGADAVGGAP